MPILTLQHENKPLREYELQKGSSISIGRHETNEVVIDDPAVSGHHAKIDSLGDRFVLTDLQSKNGSFVNEQLVNSHWLKHEDVITIGGYTLVFYSHEEIQEHPDDADAFDETQILNSTQRRRMMIKSNPTKSINVVRFWDQSPNRGKVRDVEPEVPGSRARRKKTKPNGFLIFLEGGSGQFELKRKITTIGKDPTSDIVVKGMLIDPTAATINKTSKGFNFNYIGGRPKPKVNDKPVKKSTRLNDQDIIEIGSVKLQFSVDKLK